MLSELENLASMAGAAWTTDNPIETLRARLAQETPYEIGKRLYQEGKGISFIPTAVERDDQIGEALRGFEDARLAQPEPEPVAWNCAADLADASICKSWCGNSNCISHIATSKREWQDLTKQEFMEATDGLEDLEDCWIAIQAKLREKNA